MNSLITQIGIATAIAIVPTAIGFILPRKKTILYGQLVYNLFSKLLFQTSNKFGGCSNYRKIITCLQTTLIDFAFGIYIESKKLSKLNYERKLKDHLKR